MSDFLHEPTSGFFVWTKKGKAPRFHHGTMTSAVREAERLAALYPGQKFHVMASCLKVSLREVAPPLAFARDSAAGEAEHSPAAHAGEGRA